MRRFLPGLVVGLACAASEARAGTIRITITQRAEVRAGALAAIVTVTNGGDEPAHSVRPVLRFEGDEVDGPEHDLLPPGGSFEVVLRFPGGTRGEGRWPYVLVLDYTDANRSPSQALLVATFEVGHPTPARLVVRDLRAGSLTDFTTLKAIVENRSHAPGAARMTVWLPRDLELEQAEGDIKLTPGEEKTIALPLTNRHGRPGSHYPVFAVLEAEDGHVHQASIAETAVEIEAPEVAVARTRRRLWIVAAILLTAWVGLVAFRTARRKGPP